MPTAPTIFMSSTPYVTLLCFVLLHERAHWIVHMTGKSVTTTKCEAPWEGPSFVSEYQRGEAGEYLECRLLGGICGFLGMSDDRWLIDRLVIPGGTKALDNSLATLLGRGSAKLPLVPVT